MTLNITLVTADRIYQSSDFMLTISSPYQVVSTSTTKIVQFQYENVVGFVSYTGIARWPGRDSKDTARRIAEWLDGQVNLSFDDLVDIIRSKGDFFLQCVASSSGRAFHTFTVAGFDGGVPVVALVSNFEDINGRTNSHPSVKLIATKKKYRGSAFAVVTGQRSAVHRERRKQLERLGNGAEINPNQIREVMTRINSIAASTSAVDQTISNECSVFSIDAAGNGVHELTPGSKIDPISVFNGTILPGLTEIAKLIGMDPTSMVMVGATFATSGSNKAPDSVCVPSFAEGHARYALEDISVPGMVESNPLAIGSHSGEFAVVGTCSAPQHRGHYFYWLWKSSTGHNFLPVEVENGNGILFLMDESVVVTGTVQGKQDVLRLDEDRVITFDKRGRYDSSCRRANSSGQIGGWIGGVDERDRGQHSWRPIVWDSHGEVVDMLERDRLQGADWGYVTAIDENKALVIAYAGHCPILLMWHIGGDVEVISNRDEQVIGVGFAGDSVLGFVKNERAQPVAVVRSPEGVWSRLGTEDGWTPLDSDANGNVGGRILRNGFFMPVRWNQKESLELSGYRYHNVEVSHVSKTGEMLGKASADHGSHALLWRPR